MKFFSTTRTKRNTAFVVVLGWLFAVASGVANACLLEAPGAHSHIAAAEPSKEGHAPAVLAGHVGAVDGHDDDSHASKESCLKVCDDSTRIRPNAHAGVDQTDPGPAPLIATLWTATTHVVSVPLRLDGLQVPIAGPPVRVRYSRLVL